MALKVDTDNVVIAFMPGALHVPQPGGFVDSQLSQAVSETSSPPQLTVVREQICLAVACLAQYALFESRFGIARVIMYMPWLTIFLHRARCTACLGLETQSAHPFSSLPPLSSRRQRSDSLSYVHLTFSAAQCMQRIDDTDDTATEETNSSEALTQEVIDALLPDKG